MKKRKPCEACLTMYGVTRLTALRVKTPEGEELFLCRTHLAKAAAAVASSDRKPAAD